MAQAGGYRDGSGRKALVAKPVKVLLYLEAEHKRMLEKLAKKLGARGPSAVVRRILDDYDFSDLTLE